MTKTTTTTTNIIRFSSTTAEKETIKIVESLMEGRIKLSKAPEEWGFPKRKSFSKEKYIEMRTAVEKTRQVINDPRHHGATEFFEVGENKYYFNNFDREFIHEVGYLLLKQQ